MVRLSTLANQKKKNAIELEDSWCLTRAKCEKTPVSLFKSENVFVPDGLSEHACSGALGAFFWDYSGIGLLGIDGIRVLLGAIPFSK